jgi:hypothetical protein
MKKVILFFTIFLLQSTQSSKLWAYSGTIVAPSGQTLYYLFDNSSPYSSPIIIITCPNNTSNPWPSTYTKPSGALIIPDSITHNGYKYPVTDIGENAFCECTGLTSITTGNSVKRIHSYAFQGCIGLTNIELPAVTLIDDGAFYWCSSLTSIELPSVTHIGNMAFRSCTSLTSVLFNTSNYCTTSGIPFGDCPNITNFTFGSTTKHIPSNLCNGLSNLNSINIPDSVISIGENAFKNCSGLTIINIPNTVTNIGSSAFFGCSGLTSIALPDSLSSINSYTFSCCSSLTSITIPDGIFSIGNNAFSECTNLTSVITGNGVRLIEANAFRDCTNLNSITLGDSIYGIGSNAFMGCSKLSSIIIPDNVRTIQSNAFSGCISLTSVTISDNNLTVSSIDTNLGKVYIEFPNNWWQTLYATAYDIANHHHVVWSNGSTIISQPVSLSGNINLLASFPINRYTLSININDTSLGSIILPMGNETDYGDTLIVIAEPIDHYHVNWLGQDIAATSSNKDTIWVTLNQNRTITCDFSIDTHMVAVTSSDISRGYVIGGGDFVYGTPCSVEATAYTGYTFAGWSNGVTANPYTFAVLEDVELTAIFIAPGEEAYTISVSSIDPTMGTATVNGVSSITVMNGETVTLTAIPNDGYHFLRWDDNNHEYTRNIIVNEDKNFIAYFELDDNTESIENVSESDIHIYSHDGHIIVEGVDSKLVNVFNITGRIVHNEALPNGIYLVKVGNRPALKIIILR